MSSYQHVLVATDLNTDIEELVNWARSVNSKIRKLSLIHVIPYIRSVYDNTSQNQTLEILLNQLEDQLVQLKQQQLINLIDHYQLKNTQWRLEVGETAFKINEFATDNLCDLIVLGHDNTACEYAVLGKDADEIFCNAPCDVLSINIIH